MYLDSMLLCMEVNVFMWCYVCMEFFKLLEYASKSQVLGLELEDFSNSAVNTNVYAIYSYIAVKTDKSVKQISSGINAN